MSSMKTKPVKQCTAILQQGPNQGQRCDRMTKFSHGLCYICRTFDPKWKILAQKRAKRRELLNIVKSPVTEALNIHNSIYLSLIIKAIWDLSKGTRYKYRRVSRTSIVRYIVSNWSEYLPEAKVFYPKFKTALKTAQDKCLIEKCVGSYLVTNNTAKTIRKTK